MKRLNGWSIKLIPNTGDGYCWEDKKQIDIGLNNPNPLRLLLHEMAHIGINPFGNKHTQEWFNEYLALMDKYTPGVGLSEDDKQLRKLWKLKGY